MADLRAQYDQGMAQLTAARLEQMVDTCTATRVADPGQTPILDLDGNPTPADPTTVYSGPCVLSRFRATGVRATITKTVTDDDGVPEPRTLKVPHGADVAPGDLVQMTTCAYSPDLVGAEFQVIHEDPRTFATFRSFTVRGSSWRPPPG